MSLRRCHPERLSSGIQHGESTTGHEAGELYPRGIRHRHRFQHHARQAPKAFITCISLRPIQSRRKASTCSKRWGNTWAWLLKIPVSGPAKRSLAVSEERNSLAQEPRIDSIAQGLAFLNIQVQMLQDSLRKGEVSEAVEVAGQLREGVQESYDDVRELLVHFRTRVHQSDLDTAIGAALEKFEGQTGIATRFEAIGNGLPLAATDEIQIMHIVQESLSNIRKHAKASDVTVTVRRTGAQTQVKRLRQRCRFRSGNQSQCLVRPSRWPQDHAGTGAPRRRGVPDKITAGRGTQVSLTLAA